MCVRALLRTCQIPYTLSAVYARAMFATQRTLRCVSKQSQVGRHIGHVNVPLLFVAAR